VVNDPRKAPTVTVVIPTTGRPSLVRAVRSALAQDLAPLEVVVVYDRLVPEVPAALLAEVRVRVQHSAGGAGAAAARQLGADAAAGEVVAFLDDDDEWRPDKLRLQVVELQRLQATSRHAIVSCRALLTRDGTSGSVEPARPYDGATDVADYLFVRHRLLDGGFGLASSTLVCDTALLREVPWDGRLRLHEDWDWVLRATQAGVPLRMLPEPLLIYRLQPLGSAGSRPAGGWTASAAWARSASMSAAALGDFLLCVSAVNAAAYGDRRAAFALARAAAREGRPSARAWGAFLIQALLPARWVSTAARLARSALSGPRS